jgi:hypothetical protein
MLKPGLPSGRVHSLAECGLSWLARSGLARKLTPHGQRGAAGLSRPIKATKCCALLYGMSALLPTINKSFAARFRMIAFPIATLGGRDLPLLLG